MGVTYDGHARLIRYSAGTASQAMLYNGVDERIRVITTPAVGLADTRLYLYDLDHRIVGEYGPTGAADIKAEYIWTLPEVGASGPTGGDDGTGGYMPLATAVGQTGTLNWVHGHHLGTPILTTNAAGQAITPTGTAILGFPGQFANALLLSGAQHYYNRYRDYNFATGRYIQADPIGLAGDDNPYAYAAGNPLRYTDPSGLIIDTIADVGFIGYDVYRLLKDNVFGSNCPDTLGTNLTALGADLASALIPGLTGGGVAVRAATHVRTVEQAGAKLAKEIGKNRVSIMTPSGRMQIDLFGKGHFEKSLGGNLATPHVKFQPLNRSSTGRSNLGPGKTRPANMSDIRTARRAMERRGR